MKVSGWDRKHVIMCFDMKNIESAKAILVVAAGWELETPEKHYNGSMLWKCEGVQVLREGCGRKSSWTSVQSLPDLAKSRIQLDMSLLYTINQN